MSDPVEFVINVKNSILLYGLLQEDMTLTADKEYLVSDDLVIGEGYTLTINPGVTLKISDYKKIRVTGNIYARWNSFIAYLFSPQKIIIGKDLLFLGIQFSGIVHFRSILSDNIFGLFLDDSLLGSFKFSIF